MENKTTEKQLKAFYALSIKTSGVRPTAEMWDNFKNLDTGKASEIIGALVVLAGGQVLPA